MNIKKTIYVFIICMLFLNMNMIYQDMSVYDTNKFTKRQLSYKKWRCISYYSNNDENTYKYLEKSCYKYKHDYLNFMLERSNVLFYNLIKKISIYILIIYLYICIIQ